MRACRSKGAADEALGAFEGIMTAGGYVDLAATRR